VSRSSTHVSESASSQASLSPAAYESADGINVGKV